jgi:hypothetical protein
LFVEDLFWAVQALRFRSAPPPNARGFSFIH